VADLSRVRQAIVSIGRELSRPMLSHFEGVGSGVAIAPRLVLTAAHVVERISDPRVLLAGAALPARLVKLDRELDVALLELSEDHVHVTPLPLGESSRLELGQRLYSFGFSAGPSAIVTSGIYSGLYEPHDSGPGAGAILTDAAMSPGSSGGALVTEDGRLIGLNDVANVAYGVHRAVPIDQIKRFLRER
jgi:S1-C subfamily serine protease